jgi:hypothetical protein
MTKSSGWIRMEDGGYTLREDFLVSGANASHNTLPLAEDAKALFLMQALPCPVCKTPPEQLSWIYVVISPWISKEAEGKEGWATICDRCKLQINFFATGD